MSSVVVTETSPKATTRFRNLAAAREAFSCVDPGVRRELSREAHGLLSKEPGSPQNKGPTWSPFVEASEAGHNEELAHRGITLLLHGAVDGVVASLMIASVGDAAGWPTMSTVRLQAAVLVCWGLFSACREAVETLTYAAYYKRERRREAWELDNFPEGEVEEMVQLYSKRGLPEHAARTVVNAMASSPNFFVDVMMLEELQMAPPPAVSALAASVRISGGMLLSGVPLLLLVAACSDSTPDGLRSSSHAAPPPSALDAFLHCSPSYMLLLLAAALALCYLGSVRATITHQERRLLALQTCALALPCVVLARGAGSMLLRGASVVA